MVADVHSVPRGARPPQIACAGRTGVDVLCADKTGTLPQNSLTLGTPFAVDTVSPATALST